MEATEILRQLLAGDFVAEDGSVEEIEVEAEPQWFPREGDGTEGEAQAVVLVEGKRYALTLEALP